MRRSSGYLLIKRTRMFRNFKENANLAPGLFRLKRWKSPKNDLHFLSIVTWHEIVVSAHSLSNRSVDIIVPLRRFAPCAWMQSTSVQKNKRNYSTCSSHFWGISLFKEGEVRFFFSKTEFGGAFHSTQNSGNLARLPHQMERTISVSSDRNVRHQF